MEEKKDFDTMSLIRQSVIKAGFKVDQGSVYCKQYSETHKNCEGCESQEGCDRLCLMSAVMLESIIYKPKDYDDFTLMNKRIQEKLKNILDPDVSVKDLKETIF